MKSEPGPFKRALEAVSNFRYLIIISTTVFFLFLGLAILMVFLNAQLMRDQIDKDFNQQQLILARQVAKRIDGNLAEMAMELESLCRLDIAPLGEDVLNGIILSIVGRTEARGMLGVGILDSSGSLVRLFGMDEGGFLTREQGRELWNQNFAGSLTLSPLTVETGDTVSARITAFLGRRISWGGTAKLLCAKISVSRMAEDVAGDIRSGKTGYAWVINEAGTFLYHSDNSFVGRNAFTVRQERQPYVSFTEINSIMNDRMLKGEEGTGVYESGWHRGIQGRMTKLIAFTPVKSRFLAAGQKWSVAVAAPISEVAETVHNMYLRHFAVEAAMIASMFVFGLLVTVYQLRISQALKKRVSQQEEYISSILRSSIDAIIFVDTDNKVQVWNKGAEFIFGYTSDEMIGQTFHKLVPPEIDADEELRHIQEEVDNRGYLRNYRAVRITKDGRRITIDLSRTLVRSEEGEIMGSISIIKDITEKIDLEQHIYNAEKLASIGILAAGVAHEINNPLAAILGFTDLIKERLTVGTPEYEDLLVVEQNANHAKLIVENMLGFARVSEGLEDRVDVAQALETVIDIVQNTLRVRKIDLSVKLAHGLPHAKGDPREFQQVILNLINNSIAAMSSEGGELKITAEVVDGRIAVTVADTGVGIPERIKARVFDPFFTTKKVGEGTGLGLSLCYGIVKKIGGQISFASSSIEDNPSGPCGSTFVVILPVVTDEPTKESFT